LDTYSKDTSSFQVRKPSIKSIISAGRSSRDKIFLSSKYYLEDNYFPRNLIFLPFPFHSFSFYFGGMELQNSSISKSLQEVKQKIKNLKEKMGLRKEPVLVAVSKTKPYSMIEECYVAGHRVFGENYVNELVEKAPRLPEDIQWHFIGHLQSNKCKQLLSVPNLEVVESVDSFQLASNLDKAVQSIRKRPLKIFIQVNTSQEESKSGVEPNECKELVQKIINETKNLQFSGLMVIGKLDGPSEEDFKKLVECRKQICEQLNLSSNEVELSMGMSSDYEIAIEYGSTNVRVGSSIFGERVYQP